MSNNYKKIYTIEILPTGKNNIWYASKAGKQYDADLVCKNYDHANENGIVVFEVNPCNWVYPIDCKIISERLVKKYQKI